MTSSTTDDDVQVTFEDQKKINSFARKNVRVNELLSEIKELKKRRQNIEDSSDDLLLLEDEDELIGYKIGEVFINQTLDNTQAMLENDKKDVNMQIEGLENNVKEIKQVMNDLKVKLYAKFGDSINLEA